MPDAVRLMPASPNVELIPFFVLPSSVRGAPGGFVSVTGALLTCASAELPRVTALSQQGSVLLASQSVAAFPVVIHVCFCSTGTPLPLNSKSMWAEPSRFERSHARYR